MLSRFLTIYLATRKSLIKTLCIFCPIAVFLWSWFVLLVLDSIGDCRLASTSASFISASHFLFSEAVSYYRCWVVAGTNIALACHKNVWKPKINNLVILSTCSIICRPLLHFSLADCLSCVVVSVRCHQVSPGLQTLNIWRLARVHQSIAGGRLNDTKRHDKKP